MIRKLQQWICGATTGHRFVQSFDPADTYVRLVCLDCDAEWKRSEEKKPTPRKRFDGDPERHRIRRVQ